MFEIQSAGNGDDFDWSKLETHVKPDGEFAPPERKTTGLDAKVIKYPCEACGGSGRYRGVRVHQAESKCFPCDGRGWFKTSQRDRQQARMTRATSKARKLQEAREAFDVTWPGVAAYLQESASWSSFAAELLGKLAQYGYLTDNQARAVQSMRAKVEAKRTERQAERTAGSATVDLEPIRRMFETARGNGYKRPVYRAAGLVITRASGFGKNPGALYVKTDADDYLGKIIGTAYTGRPAAALAAIALDPRGEAIRYGQRTGTCSCCGRTLTNEGSIEAGIGPVCASKWGL